MCRIADTDILLLWASEIYRTLVITIALRWRNGKGVYQQNFMGNQMDK
jgi:hypothetical protein